MAHVRAQLQYPTSFALDLVGTFLFSFLDFAAILVIFHNISQLAGWSIGEVALLYGASMVAFSIAELAVSQLDTLPAMVREGRFDVILLRPRGTLFQIVTSDFQLRRLARALQALVALGYALFRLHLHWTVPRVAVLLGMIASGAVIFGSLWIAAVVVVFWTVEGRETTNAFVSGGAFLTEFPMDAFGRWLRSFVVYVIPLAFVAYLPALYLLGKRDPFGFPWFVSFLSPAVALVTAAIAGAVWRLGVRHYQSAGG
jgi:ABC-2 type transport system permease protein